MNSLEIGKASRWGHCSSTEDFVYIYCNMYIIDLVVLVQYSLPLGHFRLIYNILTIYFLILTMIWVENLCCWQKINCTPMGTGRHQKIVPARITSCDDVIFINFGPISHRGPISHQSLYLYFHQFIWRCWAGIILIWSKHYSAFLGRSWYLSKNSSLRGLHHITILCTNISLTTVAESSIWCQWVHTRNNKVQTLLTT